MACRWAGTGAGARRPLAVPRTTLALAAGLEVKAVQIEGRQQSSATRRSPRRWGRATGVSIFAFDTEAARERLKRNGWVSEARVMRLLPSTLVVEIEERKPFALWREGGKTAAIERRQGAALAGSRSEFPESAGRLRSGRRGAGQGDRRGARSLARSARRGCARSSASPGGAGIWCWTPGLRVKLPAADFARRSPI